MIARAITTKGSSASLQYQSNPEKTSQSEVYNLSSQDPKDNWEEMKAVTEINTQTKKPISTHVISPSKEANQILKDSDYKDIAEKYAKEMGFYDNQWRFDVHKNTDDTHIHICANRINLEGKNTVKSARIGMKAGHTADKIAQERGLRTAKELTKGQKKEMENALNKCLKKADSWEDLSRRMNKKGFSLKLSERKNGEIYGARIIPLHKLNIKGGSFKEMTAPKGFKLSDINRKLTVKAIESTLTANMPLRTIYKGIDKGMSY